MTVVTPERAASSAAATVSAGGPGRSGQRRRTAGFTLAVPFAVLLTATVLVPILYALYLSLFTDQLSGLGFSGPKQVFVALGNYFDVITDSAFHASVGNVVLFALVHIPIMLGLALLLSLVLDSAVVRLKKIWSLAVFLPYAVPTVITGLIWAYLYSPGSGFTALLPFDPLSGPGILPSIVNVATWQWVGYNMIIFSTALQAVPRDVLEAARADGAGSVRTAFSIKLPMIRPTIFVALVFTVIGSLQLFTEPLVLRGFTGSVTSTWTPSLYVYEAAFISNDYGRAAAASVLLALVSALLSALVMRLSTRRSR
jgi:multiple sugar transport system permease protein